MPRKSIRTDTKKPTIYDVAKLAQVSAGTVSRALNKKGSVNSKTRQRILKAAQDLDLKPGSSAGIKIVAIIDEPSYSDRIEGYAATLSTHLSFALAEQGIAVIQPSDPLKQLNELFLDGVIAVTYHKEIKERISKLEKKMPVIYLDKFNLGPGQYAVCSDHHQAGYVAAKHLIESGKNKPGFYAFNDTPFLVRLKGFKEALVEHGYKITPNYYSMRAVHDNAYSSIAKLTRNGCDGIYVPGASLQALDAMHILQYVMGIKIPDEISIIGGENDGISQSLTPPLTTVEEPLKEMAQKAVDMFCQLSSGQEPEKKVVTLPVKIRERSSVSHT
jgi:LacI family transcriptional regulator